MTYTSACNVSSIQISTVRRKLPIISVMPTSIVTATPIAAMANAVVPRSRPRALKPVRIPNPRAGSMPVSARTVRGVISGSPTSSPIATMKPPGRQSDATPR